MLDREDLCQLHSCLATAKIVYQKKLRLKQIVFVYCIVHIVVNNGTEEEGG